MTRRRPFAAACLALALLAAAPDVRAFEVFRHSNMTGEVLARQGAGPNTLKFIQQGARWPDLTQCLSGCYCPWYVQIICADPTPAQVLEFSKSHFDNNQILPSMENVETLMSLARSWVNRGTPPANDEERKMLGTALIFFGEALHAIQDFYAHSTWVELNRDLIRIGGHLYSLPLWNGEDNAGSGVVSVGGVSVAGVQTGWVDIVPPAGSVTHDALNKDAPGTTEGAIVVNRIFPVTRIGSYYEIVSGQVGGSFNPYTDDGAAPRHTIKALQCLFSGCAIFNAPAAPGAAPAVLAPGERVDAAAVREALNLNPMLTWLESDPGMTAIANRLDSLWAASNPDSMHTFPITQFDANGWPLPATASVGDDFHPDVRLLSGPLPNPFHGFTSIRFRTPAAGRVKLEVFDTAGRRVRTLLDRDVDAGWKDVRWAGLDDDGRALPSGTYLVRLTGFGRNESTRATLTH